MAWTALAGSSVRLARLMWASGRIQFSRTEVPRRENSSCSPSPRQFASWSLGFSEGQYSQASLLVSTKRNWHEVHGLFLCFVRSPRPLDLEAFLPIHLENSEGDLPQIGRVFDWVRQLFPDGIAEDVDPSDKEVEVDMATISALSWSMSQVLTLK